MSYLDTVCECTHEFRDHRERTSDADRDTGEVGCEVSGCGCREFEELTGRSARAQAFAALSVLTLDKRIAAWLRENDPNALRQAKSAIAALEATWPDIAQDAER